MAKRLRGGSRQVSGWVCEDNQGGHLAKYLLCRWAWGDISAHQIQAICQAAVADGVGCKYVRKLAKLGKSGECERHCYEQLIRTIRPTPVSQCIKSIQMPMKNPDVVENVDVTFLYPHEVFATMFESHPEEFETRMLGRKVDQVQSFWESMRSHPSMADHPMTNQEGWETKCVPLQLHGDSVPVSGIGKAWSKSVEIYSWSSALGSASCAMSQVLVCLFHKLLVSKQHGRDTMATFWKHLVWSFHWLMLGLWPAADPDGVQYEPGTREYKLHHDVKYLAGGWRGVLWCLKGDLEYFANSLHLEHFGSHTPCFLCGCNSTDYPWTDCRPQARWLTRLWSPNSWPKRHLRHGTILDLAGLTITNVMPDVMHVKHLGTDCWFYGSVIALLCQKILGGSFAENLERIWADIYRCYLEMDIPCRFSTLKDTMFVSSSGFPKLKGSAAAVRHIGKPLLHTFEQHMDPSNDDRRRILLGLRMSTRFEDILSDSSHLFKLPDAAHRDLVDTTLAFLNIVTSLGNSFHSRGELYFNFTVKFHYLIHIALSSKHLNPVAVWCYGGEGFMQVVKKLVISSQSGTKPALVANKVLAKYAQGIGYDLLGADLEWFR
jgi:hypothetical protein